MEPKREPKWSPNASQNGTEKVKKSEVKLRELSEALGAKKRNERRSGLSSYESAGGGRGDKSGPGETYIHHWIGGRRHEGAAR